jgi:hypothetical protein
MKSRAGWNQLDVPTGRHCQAKEMTRGSRVPYSRSLHSQALQSEDKVHLAPVATSTTTGQAAPRGSDGHQGGRGQNGVATVRQARSGHSLARAGPLPAHSRDGAPGDGEVAQDDVGLLLGHATTTRCGAVAKPLAAARACFSDPYCWNSLARSMLPSGEN